MKFPLLDLLFRKKQERVWYFAEKAIFRLNQQVGQDSDLVASSHGISGIKFLGMLFCTGKYNQVSEEQLKSMARNP